MFMESQTAYNEYARLMDLGNRAYANGSVEEADEFYEKANEAYEDFEYASGIKTYDLD